MKSSLYDICEMLEDELKEIVKKGDISPNELDRVYKAVDIIKDIKTVEAMEEGGYSNEGMSGRRGRSRDGGSNASNAGGSNRSYDSYEGGSNRSYEGYSEDGSYRRGRSRDGYSMAEDKEHMLKKIEQMKKQIEQM